MAKDENGEFITCCVAGCRKRIKLNVVQKQPHIPTNQFKCFKHWDAERHATQHTRKEHAENLNNLNQEV
jgi:hypothetical protein